MASHILSLILFLLLLATELTCSSSIRVNLTVIVSRKTLPKYTHTNPLKNAPIKSPMKASKDVYTMSLAIGTPPVQFSGIMDTGSDLIWTKCGPGLFDSSKSKTFSKVNKSCESFGLIGCKQTYQDEKSVTVVLGQETISIENENFPNVIFACGTPDGGVQNDGIIGLGRGDLSLVSQLKESVFSYCLGSRFGPNSRSVFLTGFKASSENTNTQTMPLLKVDSKSYYYISLEGISVGETKLPVTKSDFAISNGYGGMIIDTGTTFTYLEKRVIDMISNEFMNQTKLEKCEDHKPNDYDELQHCFKSPSYAPFPKLVFHFEGADWELPRENYIYEKHGANVMYLAFIANDKDEDKVSIFGNMQQQNMMVIYDLDQNSLSFKPANCNLL
ncbi:hypothetical protein L1987_28096 [Smallanthus sonchifolius]|uniref:Uncharacterized protein n=1 Tax=Smallanthus sonchifolius TaxID=185202 RepID=A0ACB9ICS3_9ASTR|nr:hypothetical protein L1987_28096 [Smallanthus sonchifolius]